MLRSTSIKEVLEQIKRDEEKGYSSSIINMDDFYKEVIDSRGKFLLVSGRPSMGKTSLVLNIINEALLQGKKVDVYTGHNHKEGLVKRLLSIRSGIPLVDLERNGLKDYIERLKQTTDNLTKSDIRFFDGKIVTENDVVRSVSKSEGRDVVCILDIDFILPEAFDRRTTHKEMVKLYKRQWLDSDGYADWECDIDGMAVDPDNHLVETIVSSIKEIAKEKGFIAIGTIEHSRITEYRSSHFPHLEDLRKYGKLEEQPDMIVLLFRDIYTLWDEDEDESDEEQNYGAFLSLYYNTDDYQEKSVDVAWDNKTASFISRNEWMAREYVGENHDKLDEKGFDDDEDVPF